MSQNYTTYDKATGQVLTYGSMDDPSTLETQTIGVVIGQQHRNGWVSSGVHTPLSEQPSQHHLFDFVGKKWVDTRTSASQWELVRSIRAKKLAESDWTQLGDSPTASKQAWKTYRQALRDITTQRDPFNIVWPTPPV